MARFTFSVLIVRLVMPRKGFSLCDVETARVVVALLFMSETVVVGSAIMLEAIQVILRRLILFHTDSPL